MAHDRDRVHRPDQRDGRRAGPRLFAVIQELPDHQEARIAAWGMSFEDRTEVFSTSGPTQLSVATPERAQAFFTRFKGATARLIWIESPTPPDTTRWRQRREQARMRGVREVRRSLAAAALVAAALADTAACTGTMGGQAVPKDAPITPTRKEPSRTSPDEPTSAPSGEDALTTLDPCDLFSSSIKSSLGVTGAPEPDKTTSATICQWRVDKGSVADSFTYAVGIFPRLGIDQVVAFGEK